MPNYGLVINSRFRPFSYQEMLAPVAQATQAHQALEDAYSELNTNASIWEGLANKKSDSITYQRYKDFADALKTQADELAANGLTPTSRQAMSNLRARYAKEIVPIEQAYQRRAEQIAEQRKAGNQMIHSYDASTTSLDEFLGNPSLSYKSIDRAKLLQESTTLMSQFANELRDFRTDGDIDRFHKKLIQNYGLTKEEANTFATAIASGRIDNNNAVQALAQRIYNSTGVADWNNATASNRVWQTIAEGVTAGIGKQGATVLNNEQARYNADLANYRAKLKAADNRNNTYWDDFSEDATVSGANGNHYFYRQRKDASGQIHVDRSPAKKVNGRWIKARNDDWWEPAPYYIRDGKVYTEDVAGTGTYGIKTTTQPSITLDTRPVAMQWDAGNSKVKVSSAGNAEDILNNSIEWQQVSSSESEEASQLYNYYIGQGYEASQIKLMKKIKRGGLASKGTLVAIVEREPLHGNVTNSQRGKMTPTSQSTQDNGDALGGSGAYDW